MVDAPVTTDPVVEDLRLLKLAELYESAYEGFIVQMATQVVGDDEARAQLFRLVDPADDHAGRVAELMTVLNDRLDARGRRHLAVAALEDVVEIERSARDFYRSHAPKAHDAAVRGLFEELARAEEEHARIASKALATLAEALGVAQGTGYGYRPFRMGSGETQSEGGGSA
jgi:rubrerythrin